MTREEICNEVLQIPNNNILLQLATSVGKSKLALEIMKKRFSTKKKFLVVYPTVGLKQNWIEEFKKWGMDDYLPNVTFTTYVSLPKHKGNWDAVILDEAHHLSERCREALEDFTINTSILLSATIKESLLCEISAIFDNLYVYTIDIRTAIDEDILADPKVYVVPMRLEGIKEKCIYIVNPKAKKICEKVQPISNYWKCLKNKECQFKVEMTAIQYYGVLENNIMYYKDKARSNSRCRDRYLRLCKDRLDFLSSLKTGIVKDILKVLKDRRTLTFCSSIEQTEKLGKYCINSKNKKSDEYQEMFNNGKIKHITACNKLNEGANLKNCQIGIYANLNSSNTIVAQRLGRILRHKNPVIIIPYFVNTRDAEIVREMMSSYNTDLVERINNIKDIKI